MGTTTNVRLAVAVMLVWAGSVAIAYLAGAVNRWSPAVGQTIDFVSLTLLLPATIVAAIYAVRRPPRWPRLGADRLTAVLDAAEHVSAVVAVRVAGTQPWRPALLFDVVGLGTLLGLLALNLSTLVLILLPMAFVLAPGLMLVIKISNARAEHSARSGPRHSIARSVPRSRGRPPCWLVLTDRRLGLVRVGRGRQAELIWEIPRSELESAADTGRSLATLDRTIRLHFSDGTSIRLTAPHAGPLLAAFN